MQLVFQLIGGHLSYLFHMFAVLQLCVISCKFHRSSIYHTAYLKIKPKNYSKALIQSYPFSINYTYIGAMKRTEELSYPHLRHLYPINMLSLSANEQSRIILISSFLIFVILSKLFVCFHFSLLLKVTK